MDFECGTKSGLSGTRSNVARVFFVSSSNSDTSKSLIRMISSVESYASVRQYALAGQRYSQQRVGLHSRTRQLQTAWQAAGRSAAGKRDCRMAGEVEELG